MTPPWTINYEPSLDLLATLIVPSLEAAPKLELKPLSVTLKYVFLGSSDTLPVIIASNLTLDQET